MASPELNLNGWVSVPWTEFIGKDASHGASFSSGFDQNQATFNVLVRWEDGLQFEQDALGVSWFDGYALHRTPPVRHPFKPWLRAERIISAHPVRWDAKLNEPAELYGNGNSAATFSTQSTYDFWLISVGFAAPKYRSVDDTTLQTDFGGHEWHRFCIVEQEPEYMTITREVGTWQWADATHGPGLNGWLANPRAQVPFNAPWGQTITSWRIKVRWVRVPRYGLFGEAGTSDFLNENITNNSNYLHNNATPLWGAEGNAYSGVLKFISGHAEPVTSPFSPYTQGLGGTDPNLYYDVTLNWHRFDPPTYTNSPYRGHNLLPSPDIADPLWYLATNAGFDKTTGEPLGQGIFPTADLSIVFQLSLV